MKRMISVVVVAVLVLAAGNALARRAKPNQDMAGSKQLVFMTCEGRGAKMIGIAYNDLKHKDAADAATVICKSKARGEFIPMNQDFGDRGLVKIKCNMDEKVAGIAYKDRGGSDEADGLTVICRDKTGAKRTAFNDDLLGGRRYAVIEAMPNEIPIGIAYNDRSRGNTDAIDGFTLVVKRK